jgi:hypothetical protein
MAEISAENLYAMLGQVETELHDSALYGQVLSRLQAFPPEVGHQVQRMVQAIAREAIRLTFRKLVRKKSAGTNASSMPNPVQPPAPSIAEVSLPRPPLPPPPPCLNATVETTVKPAGVKQIVPSETELNSSGSEAESPMRCKRVYVEKRPEKSVRKRLNRKERAAQAALQAWESRLRELGQEIQQTRQAKSLTVYQLHLRTQIPLHQLEAIEAGQIDRLPEDVYIRGFLRQIGRALDLDSAEFANSLPALDPVKAILPTWYHPLELGAGVRSVHLYVGYAALLAGGLTWLSQQSMPKAPFTPALSPSETVNPAPEKAVPAQTKTTNPAAKPRAKSVKQRVNLPAAIAPPEMRPL